MSFCHNGSISIPFSQTKCSSCEMYKDCEHENRGHMTKCISYTIKKVK